MTRLNPFKQGIDASQKGYNKVTNDSVRLTLFQERGENSSHVDQGGFWKPEIVARDCPVSSPDPKRGEKTLLRRLERMAFRFGIIHGMSPVEPASVRQDTGRQARPGDRELRRLDGDAERHSGWKAGA